MKEAIKIKSVQSTNPFKSVIQTGYDIVKAHGGTLELKSELNKGATFNISFPC